METVKFEAAVKRICVNGGHNVQPVTQTVKYGKSVPSGDRGLARLLFDETLRWQWIREHLA